MKISLLEPLGVSKELIDQLSKGLIEEGHSFTYYSEKTTDIEELKKRSQDCDIVMIANNPYPNEVVESNKNLKMLNVAFTGIDHVGLESCKANNVMVCNAANYSNQTVAELAVGLAINVLRFMNIGDYNTRNGKTAAGLVGREICGKTVGIIGTGRIGIMTARLFKAFGAKVIGYSNSQKQEAIEAGIEYVSTLEELLKSSDIISLHTPNNSQTKGMISKEKIALMKETAIFINCARGPIVDNKALADALNEGRIAGAGIDVYDMEPPIPEDYPLLNAKNTVLTPHVAFASEESMVRRAHITFNNVYGFLNNKPENICKL